MYFFIGTGDLKKNALTIKLISEWNKKADCHASRITIQKLCYLAEAIGMPLNYKFDVYKYGPYSQDLFEQIDDMISYELLTVDCPDIDDKDNISLYSITEIAEELLESCSNLLMQYDAKVNSLVDRFKDMSIRDLELFSTIHYYHTAYNGYYREIDKDRLKQLTIDKVVSAMKDKFKQNEIDKAYFQMEGTPLVFC